jgi:putative transposase
MPKEGHTDEQIIAAPKQHESGAKTVEICPKLGISQATFYLWKINIRGWECRRCPSCGSCAKKTGD